MTPNTEHLVHRLRFLMHDQQLNPGDRVGTERGLAEQFGVGRALLRQALAQLEREGTIRRAIGRNGGVIHSDGKVHRRLDSISAVPAYLREQGYQPNTRVLKAALTTANAEDGRALRLNPGDPIYTLSRLRLADGIPLSLELARLPARAFPKLLQLPLENSLYQLLSTVYRREPAVAEEQIEGVAITDATEAGHLGVLPGAVGLRIRRITLDQDGQPIEFARDLFRADRTRIEAQVRGLHRVVIPAERPERPEPRNTTVR